MSDNKQFGPLTIGFNEKKDYRTAENRSEGVYYEATGYDYIGNAFKYATFDVDLIPSLIEHLQAIYDGYPKPVRKTTREQFAELAIGTRFKLTFSDAWEYIKVSEDQVYDVLSAKLWSSKDLGTSYDIGVIK